MKESQLTFGQRMGNVSQLERVDAHVVISYESRNEFAVQRIVAGIQSADAPVRVVISVHADAKWAVRPHGRGSPVIVVVTEAVHLLVIALAVVHGREGCFATLLFMFTP